MKLDLSYKSSLMGIDEGGAAREPAPGSGGPGRAVHWRAAPPAPRAAQGASLGRALVGWLRAWTGYREPALQLRVDGKLLRFGSPEDFDFCLVSKTHLPAARIPALMALPLPRLERQAAELRDMEQRLADLLACARGEGGGADEVLRALEPNVFSQDHAWRSIMQALVFAGPGVERFCELAMTRYLDYMVARQLVIQHLCEHKAAHIEAEAGQEPADGAMYQTAVFDLARMDLATRQVGGLRRLARGVATPVHLPRTGEVELMLSRHRFMLVGGRHWYLEDDAGQRYGLRAPSCVVGRLRSCDTVLPPTFSAVSRRHLVIEVRGPDRALITDLSSHGTFLSPEASL